MFSLTLNVLIAVMWLLLSSEPSIATFVIGFLVGLGMLTLFRDVLPRDQYIKRVTGFVRFCFIFLREFVAANLDMARIVLFQSKEELHPNFLTLDVSGLHRWEILLLTHCISLTPGSTSVQISEDFKTVLVHALAAEDPAAVRRQINQKLRQAILEFSRA